MRPWKVYAALMLGMAGVALGQSGPLPKPAAWATSSQDAPANATAPAVVIASSQAGQQVLPAEARLPLPDDGLRLSPAQATTASAAAQPPGLMPNVATPTSLIQQAVYVTGNEPPGGSHPPIQPVTASESSARETRRCSAVSVEVVGPVLTAPGQNAPCQLLVRNLGSLVVTGVLVELPIPSGIRVLATKPEAQREPDKLSWQLGNLEVSGERRIDFEVQAGFPGELQLGPMARFTAAMALRSNIVRPPFAITVTNPDAVSVGERVVLQIQVGNHTAEPIRRVNLRCELPPGLTHPQGQVIEADLGEDFAPGQVRTIQLEIQARQAGRHVACLSASAEGGHTAKTTASLNVNEPTLNLVALGPRQATLNQDVTMQLEVSNPGHRAASSVRVTQILPQGVEFLSASTGGLYNPVLGSITWTLTELPADQRQTLTFQIRARQAGDWALSSSVQVEGMATVRATYAVQIEATPTVSLEVTPMDDPLIPGRDTTYELRVYNAGPGSARGLRVVVHIPDVLTPVSGDGPTQWQIRGQDLYFDPLPEMRGRVDAVYRVRVRGARIGQGAFRAEIHAAGLQRPITNELTSHITSTR